MGSSSNPLGSGEPSGPSGANNLTLLGYNQNQIVGSTNTGNELINSAQQGLGAAQNYEEGVLSGNRSDILATEAPEISSLLTSYDSTRKAEAQLQPRGGGRSADLNELPYKELGDVNKLIQTARPEAAKELTSTASAEGYLGSSEEALAASDVNTSLNFLLGKAGVQLDSAKLQSQEGQQLGQAIGTALPQLLLAAGIGG
jgi:hypothetical protein